MWLFWWVWPLAWWVLGVLATIMILLDPWWV